MKGKSGMKKLWYGLAAAVAAVIIGCATLPTIEKMFENSRLVGVATAMVANTFKIDDTCRAAITGIVEKVQYSVPQTNETFETAWTPIAEQHIQKLFDESVIDKDQCEIIRCAFKTVVKGIDYLMNVRYPQARQYQELTESAVHGFCDGFLSKFNSGSVSCGSEFEYDAEAYEYVAAAVKIDSAD